MKILMLSVCIKVMWTVAQAFNASYSDVCPLACLCSDCVVSMTAHVTCSGNSTTRTARASRITDCICIAGYFGNWSFSCVECVSAEYCPLDSSVPMNCPVGYECTTSVATPLPGLWRNNFSTFELCPGGFVCSRSWDREPIPCVGGTYCNNGSDASLVCPPSFWCSNMSVIPTECPAHYFCPEGSLSPWECPGGSFCLAGVDRPLECLPGFFCPAQSSMPVICPFGKLCNESGMSAPLKCPLGMFCVEGSASPIPCIDGFVCLEGTGDPVLCPAGFYCMSGISSPIICPVGGYCAAGSSFPIPCEAGFYCEEGSISQTVCPAAAFCSIQSGNFTPCPSSYFCPEGSPLPTLCPAASVCPFQSSMYEPCPVGYMCDVGVSAGTICPVGFFCVANVSSPEKCAPGVLCMEGSGDESVTCPGGMLCNGSDIVACPPGFYCVPGSFEGLLCVEGSFCSAGLSEPIPCDPGVLCLSGSVNNMNLCPAGMVCVDGLASSCPSTYFCPMGSYAGVGCTAGGYCLEGSSAPIGCPPSKFCPQGVSAPVSCPAGSYCEADAAEPVQCPELFYCPHESESPRPCPLGRVCPAGSSSTDNACPNGLVCAGGSVLGLCPMAYFCIRGEIEICPGGFVCPEGTSIPSVCEVGTYCPTGSFETLPCPENFYCHAQSEEIAPCPSNAICPATVVRPCVGVPTHYENLTRFCAWNCGSGYSENVDRTQCLEKNATSFATLLDFTIGSVTLNAEILHNITRQIEEKSGCGGVSQCQVVILSITESNGTVIYCDRGVCPGYDTVDNNVNQFAGVSTLLVTNTVVVKNASSSSLGITTVPTSVKAIVQTTSSVNNSRTGTLSFVPVTNITAEATPLVGLEIMDANYPGLGTPSHSGDVLVDEITSTDSDDMEQPVTNIAAEATPLVGLEIVDANYLGLETPSYGGDVLVDEITSTDSNDMEQQTTSDVEDAIFANGFGRKLLQVSVSAAPIVSVGVISNAPVLENITFNISIGGVSLHYTSAFNIVVNNNILADTKVLETTVKDVIQALKETPTPASQGTPVTLLIALAVGVMVMLGLAVCLLCFIARKLHINGREYRDLHAMVENGLAANKDPAGGELFSEMPAMTSSLIPIRITLPYLAREVSQKIKSR